VSENIIKNSLLWLLVLTTIATVITYGNVILYIPTHKSVHLQHCYYQV